MSRPGVEVYSAAWAPPVGVPTDTSVAFIAGESQRGDVTAPTLLHSLDEFSSAYGDRVVASQLAYDSVDAYFHEGGNSCYFMRVADGGVAATVASTAICAGTTATAQNPGTWGNQLSLAVTTAPTMMLLDEEQESGGKSSKKGKDAEDDEDPRSELLDFPEQQAAGFIAIVSYKGSAVQTSATLATNADLQAFLLKSPWLQVTGGTLTTALAVGTVTLTGGTDPTTPATGAALVTALAAIPATLGPGQVLAPGRSANADQAAVLAHAAATNRYALLDGALSANVQSLQSAAALLRGSVQDRYGMLWGPWAVIPGVAPGTTRMVPWSAVQAGLIARNDLAGNPNQAAAGPWGQTQWVIGLAQAFTTADMQAALYSGVCTARSVYGTIEAYAFRSLSDPAGPNQAWVQANHGRLAMAIVAEGEATGEAFVFSQIDGRGLDIAAFGGALAGDLIRFYNAGALYGDDPTEAFVVNVGSSVNTIAKLADGILSAVVSVRMSPHAELVQITIVKTPITVSLV